MLISAFILNLLASCWLSSATTSTAASDVSSSPPMPSADHRFQSLQLGYTDFKRVHTRPLSHLGLTGPHHEPRAYITSAFLDTRPFLDGQTAILRMMLYLLVPDRSIEQPRPAIEEPLYCMWVTGQDKFMYSPMQTVTYGYLRAELAEHMGSCNTSVSQALHRTGGSGTVPRFATVVKHRDAADVEESTSWVHVNAIPIVHEDARAVQAHYGWGDAWGTGRSDHGPFMTPQQYHDGDGEVASCSGTPITGNGYFAAYLPQWLAFQKVAGVSKVLVYLLDPNLVELRTLQYYEDGGLVEQYHMRISRHMGRPSGCSAKGDYHRASLKEGDGQQWTACVEYALRLYWWGQLGNAGHCLFSAMGRYRWLVMHDLDEWLVSRWKPVVTYTELFKRWRATDQGRDLAQFGQNRSGSVWPVSFQFQTASVCVQCRQDLPRVVVAPEPWVPTAWLETRPSLHAIFWSVVRAPPKDVGDRSKNVFDPLAVLIVEVHELHRAYRLPEEQEAGDAAGHDGIRGGAGQGPPSVNIPSGEYKGWANVDPDLAMIYHARVKHHYQQALRFWMGVARANATVAASAGPLSVEDDALPLSTTLIEISEHCNWCDCYFENCRGEHNLVVKDYTIVNLYGEPMMQELNGFVRAFRFPE